MIWARWISPKLSKDDPDDPELRRLEREYGDLVRQGKHAEFVARFREAHPQEYLKLFV